MNFNYFFKLSIGILITLKLSMAQDVVVSLGEPTIISNPGVPIYPWFPDGHISLIKDGDQNQMYWAGSTSYRTLGQDVSTMKSPAIAVLSKEQKEILIIQIPLIRKHEFNFQSMNNSLLH